MTIGKIHCAKLIHENYKYLKRKGTQPERVTKHTGFGYELVTSSSKCSCFVNPGVRKNFKFCYLAGQRLNYLTFTRGIFKVEREEERSTANSKVGGFV